MAAPSANDTFDEDAAAPEHDRGAGDEGADDHAPPEGDDAERGTPVVGPAALIVALGLAAGGRRRCERQRGRR